MDNIRYQCYQCKRKTEREHNNKLIEEVFAHKLAEAVMLMALLQPTHAYTPRRESGLHHVVRRLEARLREVWGWTPTVGTKSQ